jgi:hypothetical protein
MLAIWKKVSGTFISKRMLINRIPYLSIEQPGMNKEFQVITPASAEFIKWAVSSSERIADYLFKHKELITGLR